MICLGVTHAVLHDQSFLIPFSHCFGKLNIFFTFGDTDTDADICNLLMYGIEGTHYQVTADGKAAPAEGLTLENSGYSCGFINGWVLPNMLNAYPSYTGAESLTGWNHR